MTRLRILSYNILKGGIGRESLLAAVIASQEPDLVVLQEAYRPEVVQRLADTCGFEYFASSRGHSVACLSRVAMGEHVWRRTRWAKRAYLEIVTAAGVRIFGVHLSAVHSNLTEQRRAHELRMLLRSVERHQRGLHVVTGDFNTLAPGERLDLDRLPPRLRALAWVTGKSIRWITIRMMLEAGYVDGYRKFHGDEGFTFSTWDPHVRLDYAFLPEAFKGQLQRCDVVRDHPSLNRRLITYRWSVKSRCDFLRAFVVSWSRLLIENPRQHLEELLHRVSPPPLVERDGL